MHLLRKLSKLTNLSLRGATLALRFGLSFYIIKLLGYEASGIYGLALGLIGLMPAVVGWGLNYFVSREVVGQQTGAGMLLIRDRLVVTLISLSAASLLAVFAMTMLGYDIRLLYILIAALVWMETISLDMHLPLIGMEMPFQANILVFIRTALWVVPVVLLGIYVPQTRTLENVFIAWLIGHFAGFVVLVYFIRHWPLEKLKSVPVDFGRLRERLSHSWFIYLSDLGLVGLIYVDRYIVSSMLGLTLTGIYTFYWSLTNALQTLVQTAVVQLALPALVRAFQDHAFGTWKATLRTEFIKTLAISIVLSVAIYGASEMIIEFLAMQDLREHRLLFILLLLAAVIRSCSDLFNVGLTSTRRDGHYAVINIAGVFLSVALAFVCIHAFGLNGAGIAAVLTSLVLTVIRAFFLRNAVRQTEAGLSVQVS